MKITLLIFIILLSVGLINKRSNAVAGEDEENWVIFPASMGEDQAWISTDTSYSKIAAKDKRIYSCRVRLKLKEPNQYGLPTNQEFSALTVVDDEIQKSLETLKGIYVGRVTVGGYRYSFYYFGAVQEKINEKINHIRSVHKYEIDFKWEKDEKKKNYWENLYPTTDDWQVINDLKVLDALQENGDNNKIKRRVDHWAYFDNINQAHEFKKWLSENGYSLDSINETENEQPFNVRFFHQSTMVLADITYHTIRLNRKASELKGEYDGWETSVEK